MQEAIESESKGEACRSALVESVRKIWFDTWGQKEDSSQVGVILSGGVDTCAVVEALHSLGLKPCVALTVYVGEQGTDRPYAQAIAEKFSLRHVELQLTPEQLLSETLEFAVKTLGTFDGMELRNSIVVARALLEAQKLGVNYLLTGDASDELLGGYSFTHGSEDPIWTQKRNEMCASWFFSAPVLGKALGLNVESPYYTEPFKSFGLSLTKSDCIAERWLEAAPGTQKELRRTGKVPLREAFPDSISAWRRKDPIEVGSGSTLLGAEDGKYFAQKVGPRGFMHEKQSIASKYKISIRNAEHLFYFKVFEKEFRAGLEGDHLDTFPVLPERRISKAESLPPIVGTEKKTPMDNACIGCQFMLPLPTSNFCKVCGAWPARKQSTATALLL